MFKKTPKNVYQLYHSSLHFDTKKIYRYLRYCIKTGLLEIDHIEQDKFMPSKHYRLTQKGRDFTTLFNDQQNHPLAPKQYKA
jgi:DNA-binding PadR family transcriptional regulator